MIHLKEGSLLVGKVGEGKREDIGHCVIVGGTTGRCKREGLPQKLWECARSRMVHAARHAEWPCHYITFQFPSLSALEVTKSAMVCHCTMHHLRPHRGGKAAWYLLFASSHGNLYTILLQNKAKQFTFWKPTVWSYAFYKTCSGSWSQNYYHVDGTILQQLIWGDWWTSREKIISFMWQCCAATETCMTNTCMQKAKCFHHFLTIHWRG